MVVSSMHLHFLHLAFPSSLGLWREIGHRYRMPAPTMIVTLIHSPVAGQPKQVENDRPSALACGGRSDLDKSKFLSHVKPPILNGTFWERVMNGMA